MLEWKIKCGSCGEETPAVFWIERPSGLQLPMDCFQCPKCSVAIKRVTHRPALPPGGEVPTWYGSYITLEKIPAWL